MNRPEEAIDDELTALNLLREQRRVYPELVFPLDKRSPCCIDRNVYAGPYDSMSGRETYYVTHRLAEALRSAHLVRGKPQWGYTDNRHCRITDYGVDRAIELERARKEKEERNADADPNPA